MEQQQKSAQEYFYAKIYFISSDATLWSFLHLRPPYSDRLMELTVCDTHVSAAYCHHRPEVAGEEEQQEDGGNAYTVDVMAVKGGSLMHR